MMGVINEDRFKGYKRFLKNNVFTNFPDYVINDMFRETGDLDYKDIQGMSKDEIINYFHNKTTAKKQNKILNAYNYR